MKGYKSIVLLLLLLFALAGSVSEFSKPRIVANCAECGDGPKDKKCADGYKCVDGKCVKK